MTTVVVIISALLNWGIFCCISKIDFSISTWRAKNG